jgi:6-phosphogluconolactonase (cycloisomerase 2 family)
LYATAGANVLGYSFDVQTGALSPLLGFPVAVGAIADSISIDPTNHFLYVKNGSTGKITGFGLNAATGELTPMPGSPFAVGTSADFVATF